MKEGAVLQILAWQSEMWSSVRADRNQAKATPDRLITHRPDIPRAPATFGQCLRDSEKVKQSRDRKNTQVTETNQFRSRKERKTHRV